MSSSANAEPAAALTPDAYQTMAGQTEQYQQFSHPMRVLSQGFGDEITEILEQAYGDAYWTTEMTPPEKLLPLDDYTLELGDLLWYGSQIVRLQSEKLSTYISTTAWSSNSVSSDTSLVTCQQAGGEYAEMAAKLNYDFTVRPVGCLAILAAQLADARPTPVESRYGVPYDLALHDMFRGIMTAANVRQLSLRKIALANLAKLAARTRQPHTVTHVRDRLPSLLDQKRTLWLAAFKQM